MVKSRNVGWVEGLTAAGIDVSPSASLPLRVSCPFCRGHRLTAYEDSNTWANAWHHCPRCNIGLDTIGLVAKVHGIAYSTAANKLRVPVEAAERSEAEAIRQNRIHQFWQYCSTNLSRSCSPQLTRLRNRLHFMSTASPERWTAGPGQMLGGCHYKTAAEAIQPPGGFSPKNRPFKGTGWGDVLVIPFHDRPGRICGFQFVGRDGGPDDTLYRAVLSPTKVPEAGLACGFAAQNATGEYLFVHDDPLLAIRLQVRALLTSGISLPVVGMYHGHRAVTCDPWNGITDRTLVFWGWTLTPAMLKHAVLTNGLIAVLSVPHGSHTPPTAEQLSTFLRAREPWVILHRLRCTAKPWSEFLTAWSRGATDGQIEDLIHGCRVLGLDPEIVCINKRIRSLTRPASAAKRTSTATTFGPVCVSESFCRWISTRENGESRLLSNAPFRIVRTVATSVDADGIPQARYVIELQYRLRTKKVVTIPFSVPVEKFHKNAKVILQGFLSDAVPGATLFVATGWTNEQLIELALRLNPPEDTLPQKRNVHV